MKLNHEKLEEEKMNELIYLLVPKNGIMADAIRRLAREIIITKLENKIIKMRIRAMSAVLFLNAMYFLIKEFR